MEKEKGGVKRKMQERAWEQKMKQAIIQKSLFSGSMEGTVSLWSWGKKTPERHPEHENQVSTLNHSRRILLERNWRVRPQRLKVVFANTSCHIFTFLKTHENCSPHFCFRIQDSAKCPFSDGCTDRVFNHFSMYKVIFISFICCFWY